MKRMLTYVMVLGLLLFLMAGVQIQVANAGWLDIWCVGEPSGIEICITEDGDILPGTASVQDIGSASYPYSILHLQTLTLQTGLTAPTATISGAVYIGALATRSSFTAAGDAVIHDDMDVVGDLTAATIVSDAGVSGTTLDFSSNADIDGQLLLGAIATKSTVTAAGVMNLHGALTAATLTSVAGVAGTTGDFSGNFDIDGNLEIGADTFVSTFTASTGLFTPHRFVLPSHASPQASITPLAVGEVMRDSTADEICRSTIAAVGGWVLFIDSGTVCSN